MAITADQSILAMLKVYYRDSVQNLLFRNSPLLKKIGRQRVEGREQRFAAIYSRGGAVAGNFLTAETKAAQNVKNAEFIVTPGQIFSVFAYNAKEVQASLTKRGAYLKVAGNKAFAATEAFRKTLAGAVYGRGYGEVGVLGDAYSFTTTGTTITLSDDAIMKIDVDSSLDVKPTINSTSILGTLTVTAIDGNNVTVITNNAFTGSDTDILALSGSMASGGAPYLPIGLDAWLPIVEGRDENGTVWPTFIQTTFNGVNRAANVEGLAGNFVDGSAAATVNETVQKLIQRCRRRGSQADIITLNDDDFLTLTNEIQTTNTYFTATSTKSRRSANIGFDKVSASFSTNYIDNIIDDPFCPKGKVYVLDSEAVELWTYTNADSVNDGIANNDPGKQNPEDFNDKGRENDSYKLLIDDYITAEPGTATADGPAVRVTLNFFGSLVVLNPSVCGVALLKTVVPTKVLGYTL